MGVGGCEAWDNYNPTFHLILHAHRMRNARNHGSSKKNKFFCRKCISLLGHWLLKRGLFCKKQSDLSSRSLLTFSKILPITITPRLRRQILSRAVSENNIKPKSLDGFLPVTLLLRNTINFQLSCVRDVTSLI